MAIQASDIARVKAMGFLLNRGTENFSGRIVPAGSVFSAEELAAVAELAARFGGGKIAFTTRLTAEVVGIPYDNIAAAVAFAAEHGLLFGGTGAKIRPVAACKGTTCIYGNFDTQALARELHEAYYCGWGAVKLPHKFKIAVGGCPNSCMKPSLNDFGIEGHCAPVLDAEKCRGCKVCQIEKRCPMKAATLVGGKLQIDEAVCKTCGVCGDKCPFGAVSPEKAVRYQLFVGGTWGKHTRVGTPLRLMVTREEISPILETCLLWYQENGGEKERFGAVIDRLGIEALENALAE